MLKLIFKQAKEFFYNLILAFRSLFWKRQNDIVLFGAWFGNRFADNSRFLYQYLSENMTKHGLSHVVWVTNSQSDYENIKEMGYEVYMMYSKESVHYHKVAGYHFICESHGDINGQQGDIIGKYSYGAKRINLWHGVGAFKKVDYAEIDKESGFFFRIKKWLHINSRLYRIIMEEWGGWGDCYFISTSDACREQWKSFFELPDDRYIDTNVPRNCEVIKLTSEEKEIVDFIENFKYVSLYLPTFRENLSYDMKKLVVSFMNELKKSDILWIQKAHSADKNNVTRYHLEGNVLELDPSFDINIILQKSSVIITDYSSVATDALYYNKPIVFFIPDYEEYNSKDRGFVDGIEDRFCGPIINDPDALFEIVCGCCAEPERYIGNDYISQRNMWWKYDDGYEKMWNKIMKTCGGKGGSFR